MSRCSVSGVMSADHAVEIRANRQCRAYLDTTRSSRQRYPSVLERSPGLVSFRKCSFARAVEEAALFLLPVAEAIELMGTRSQRHFVARNDSRFAVCNREDDPAHSCNARGRSERRFLSSRPRCGGKGMRIVRDLAELDDAVTQAQSETALFR